MNFNKILVVLGEPNSIFSEVLFKYFNSKNFKKNKSIIIIVGNKKLIFKQMGKLRYDFKINQINSIDKAKKQVINLIDIDYKFKKPFSKISSSSNKYIENSFKKALQLIKINKISKLINGPVSKKYFLKKKFPGITEYVGFKTNTNNPVMLIYNEKLSVVPLTTHIPLKNVAKLIKKKKIIDNIIKVDLFYKLKLKKIPKIAILGLNPHCETTDKISEEKTEIIPAINYLKKKKIKISGPFSADTFFLKKNIKEFDVVVGMYHDQVLTPIKTLFKFKAINVTVGLPFVKVTPDHGPNQEMIGKNTSDPSSIIYAFKFLNKINDF
tara:strand:- start:3361 stop:4332 length:972 start_codon:yes stop_codon:yes gene_type:complete